MCSHIKCVCVCVCLIVSINANYRNLNQIKKIGNEMLDIMKLRTHENSVTVTVHEKNKMKKLTHSMPENFIR